ncbi:MAG: hypothetical protein R3C12_00090 [Planctomycetaceae bacterium]
MTIELFQPGCGAGNRTPAEFLQEIGGCLTVGTNISCCRDQTPEPIAINVLPEKLALPDQTARQIPFHAEKINGLLAFERGLDLGSDD